MTTIKQYAKSIIAGALDKHNIEENNENNN